MLSFFAILRAFEPSCQPFLAISMYLCIFTIATSLNRTTSLLKNHSSNIPIGIFDSGVGGLTVLEAVTELLPKESYYYYGDSGNCPYGEKSKEEILALATAITSFLAEKGCKLIVVACNTITTNIIDKLRAQFPIPIVGMEPAIKPAAKASATGKVAVLATKGTLSGELYNKTKETYASDIEVINLIGTGLVELIESNNIDTEEMEAKLTTLIDPAVGQGVDTLVLGCTHYNYLIPVLTDVYGTQLKIINSASAVARRIQEVLKEKGQLGNNNNPQKIIFTTGNTEILSSVITRLNIKADQLVGI